MERDEVIIQDGLIKYLSLNHLHLVNPKNEQDKITKMAFEDGFRSGVDFALSKVENMIDEKQALHNLDDVRGTQ